MITQTKDLNNILGVNVKEMEIVVSAVPSATISRPRVYV